MVLTCIYGRRYSFDMRENETQTAKAPTDVEMAARYEQAEHDRALASLARLNQYRANRKAGKADRNS